MGELGKHLIAERRARGHSQAAAAVAMGVSQSAVSKWEKNLGTVDATNLATLNRYLRKVPKGALQEAIVADSDARRKTTPPATQVEVETLRAEVAELARRMTDLRSWVEGALGRRPPP